MTDESPFARYLRTPEASLDLARAALLIASDEYPQLDVEAYLGRLDTIAAAVRAQLCRQPSTQEVLLALNRHLFEEQGFAGNVEDYYDPRNSFLNEVLDRKLGIPITLSILYMEIGRRLEVPLEGVAFPGHFLVKLDLGGCDLVLDPFHGGQSLSAADLAGRIANLFGSAQPLRIDLRQLLAGAPKKDILERMLRNLKAIYLRQEDLSRALSTCNRILTLAPASALDFRDRAMVLDALECAHAAVADYRRYLELAPNAPDADEVRERVAELRETEPRLS